MCYLPPQTTESTQAIDAGFGRSVRCTLGNLLDAWLMEEENMLRWEGKMTASERRVLINHLVAEATEKVMKNDEMRVNCFVRTGSLLQHTKSEADDLIKPQGVRTKIVIPDSCAEETVTAEFTAPSVTVTPEEEILGNLDANIIEETAGDNNDAENDLTIYEDNNDADPELGCEEQIEDASVAESIDELDFQD